MSNFHPNDVLSAEVTRVMESGWIVDWTTVSFPHRRARGFNNREDAIEFAATLMGVKLS
jgi:hypothetical protein